MTLEPRARGGRMLWRHLWLWALMTLLAIWLILATVAYYTGLHEADEINDGQLVAFAQILLRQDTPPAPRLSAHDAQRRTTIHAPELRAMAWYDGRLAWDTHGMAPVLPANPRLGLQTLRASAAQPGPVWRAYVAETESASGGTHRVAVLVDMGWRRNLGRDIAEHIVRPALILLPLVALLLAWAIRRGLAPLERLSHAIEALDLDAGQTLPAQQPFQELSSTVNAINALVQRLQSQLARERRFTSDVAHELRTPLTSMLLQSRLAREAAQPAQAQESLRQVEHDALRAARILGQLLDLARAQTLEGQPPAPVDLCALARQVVAAHAPLAHERGQDLALEAPDVAVQVPGHATMLELALRNLVDNALRHTPAGTLVEVHVGHAADGGGFVSVHDNGARAGSRPTAEPGMGVGLTLVQRIADAHGIALEHTAGKPAAPQRFTLAWPPPPLQTR